MAKKKYSYPIEKCINVETMRSPSYVSVSSLLSKVNHRLYRQSRKYHAEVKLTGNATAASGPIEADVYVLNNTWYLQKAVAFARAAYEKSVKEEKKVLKGQLARWHDFRMNLAPGDGDTSVGNTSWTELHPVLINGENMGQISLTQGDFTLSVSRDEDANTSYNFGLWVTGPNSGNQFNILQEYNKSQNTDAHPSTITSGTNAMPYDAIDDEAQTSTFVELQNQGDEPPYDKDGMATQYLWRHAGRIFMNDDGQQKISTGMLCCPLGVIAIVPTQNSGDVDVCIHAKLGDYKGVASEAMS